MKNRQSSKRSEFFRTLAQYSALGGAMIGSMNQALATIQYNSTSSGPHVNTTINIPIPAGTLSFKHSFGAILNVVVNGGVSVSATGFSSWANMLNSGVSVSGGGNWKAANYWLGYSTQGPFPGSTGKFMAFRFNDGGVKYGWIRLNVPSASENFSLVDWAYEDDGSPIITGDTGPTPIELISFLSKSHKDAVDLKWTTGFEQGFDGFSIERAEEGGSFSEIAWIAGKGDTQEEQQYGFTDEAVLPNKRYYYRLKSIDLDGSFEYSHIVEASISGFGLAIEGPYPNPVTNTEIKLDIKASEAEAVRIRLFSVDGQLVYHNSAQLSEGNNEIAIPTKTLSSGVYFLKVQSRYYNRYKKIEIAH